MLSFRIKIINPYQEFGGKTLFCKNIKVTKNSSIELQLDYASNYIFEFGISITGKNQDHKGTSIDIALFGVSFMFSHYDHRHSEEY